MPTITRTPNPARFYDAEVLAAGSGRTVHTVPLRTSLNAEQAADLYGLVCRRSGSNEAVALLRKGEAVSSEVAVTDGHTPRTVLRIRRTK